MDGKSGTETGKGVVGNRDRNVKNIFSRKGMGRTGGEMATGGGDNTASYAGAAARENSISIPNSPYGVPSRIHNNYMKSKWPLSILLVFTPIHRDITYKDISELIRSTPLSN